MDLLEILKDFNPRQYASEIKMQCPYKELHSKDSQQRSQAFLNVEKNKFHCFSCGAKNTAIGLLTTRFKLDLADAIDLVQFNFVDKEFADYEESTKHDFTLPEYEPEYVIHTTPPEFFLDRGFRASILKEFRVGTCVVPDVPYEVIAIPYYSGTKLVGIKYRVEGDKRYFWYSPGFRKGNYLYGKPEGKKIILVEGETDRWRSIQHGLPYTAAILGTEVTPYHVSELKKYDTIYIGFDNDSAGFLAKEKAYLKLRPYVEDIRFIPYPSSDPGDSTKVEWIGGILSAVDYAVYSYDMSILVPDYDLIQKTARRFVKDS